MTYSGFWIRFLAVVIDAIIIGAVAGVFSFAGPAVAAALSTMLGWIYFSLMTAYKGRTLGKMALGIKVINAEGGLPTMQQAIIREVPGKIISGLLLVLGYIWAGFDPEKQAWHDKIAQTHVVPAPKF